ncbi:MAG: M28 family peptidase [Bacteroidota bacterium]|nr:M28 family peptidase [Bacteroidota bacterium]
MKSILGSLFLLFALSVGAQKNQSDDPLLQLVRAFAATSSVTGREGTAADFIQSLFPAGEIKQDKLGNLVMTLGSGFPKRLLTAPLDEPGYVVSQITADGYLRITPVGRGFVGTMAHQFLEGNEVMIGTEQGIRYGVCTVPSTHYEGLRAIPEKSKPVFQWQEAFVDVGAGNAKQVEEMGIHLLDPLTLHKKPLILQSSLVAPAAKVKSAAIALAMVAKTLQQHPFQGTVVIAWTCLDLLNGKGLADVIRQNGPFEGAIRFNRTGDNSVQSILQSDNNPLVKKQYQLGLPASYANTPVEMVSLQSIDGLMQNWLSAVGVHAAAEAVMAYTPKKEKEPAFKQYLPEARLLDQLVARYGVSTQENRVRDFILSELPKWAKPETDAKGNIILTFGKGKQHIGFVAHMDETGFLVDSIRDDGSLVLKTKGGFFPWLWEGQGGLIHIGNKDLPVLFEPRNHYLKATQRFSPDPLIVNAGFGSRAEALAAGVEIDKSSVTMPKKMIRLNEQRATARGFDDRAGCAALLLAVQQTDPSQIPYTVTCVWSVEEETGLTGSNFAAASLQDLSVVYPIDTYVSSDAPTESKIFGDCPLGKGAVIRVLESINFVNRTHLKTLQDLAARNKIPVQYGMTAGGTDGQGFLEYDIPSVPLSWPGRYSHSPIEVLDFSDLHGLVELIKAIMK